MTEITPTGMGGEKSGWVQYKAAPDYTLYRSLSVLDRKKPWTIAGGPGWADGAYATPEAAIDAARTQWGRTPETDIMKTKLNDIANAEREAAGNGYSGPIRFTERRDDQTDDEYLETIVGEAVGAASVCWSDIGEAGEFDSTRALEVVAALLAALATIPDTPQDVTT